MARNTRAARAGRATHGAASRTPAVPLGSLTQPAARTGHTCRACGTSRVTRIAMSLTDGTPVQFTSCHNCEHRSWEQEGGAGNSEVLAFAHVLDKTRKPA